MKQHTISLLYFGLVAEMTLAGFSGTAIAQNVCGRGLAEPPFLSFGADSNLLLLFDNSGSMLDMAYIDQNYQCFDEGFVSGDTYAGNFQTDGSWFLWRNTVPTWRSDTPYSQNDLVTYEGVTYRAWSSGTSTGNSIADDNGVDWQPVLRPDWRNNTFYHAYSFIFTRDAKVYYNPVEGTSNGTGPESDSGVSWTRVLRFTNATTYDASTYVLGDDMELFFTFEGGVSNGTKPINDTSVDWIPVDFHTWRPNVNYAQYDIVTYDSMIYFCQSAGTSTGTTIFEDALDWQRIDEGYFENVSESAALEACRSAAGAAYYSNADMCVTINNSGVDTPNYVSAMAASGNLLNWATASKFDIQKDILTGGKYNIREERIISENRGCAGNRFIKQVPIQQTSPSPAGMYLTMAVRMPSADDRVDWADDTTRLEIYAITENGMDFEACQDAIEAFQDPGGLGPAEADVEACVGFDASPGAGGNVTHIIYHKALQECWFYAKHGRWKGGNDHPRMTCPSLYTSVSPLDISPWDPEYVCYGVFDETLPHDERTGFVGRCWEFGSGAGGATCDPYTRDVSDCDWTAQSPCTFWMGGNLFRNRSDSSYTEICTQLNNQGTACQNNNRWRTYYTDSSSGASCDPTDDTYYGGVPTYWSPNLDGDDSVITPPEPDADDVADICVDQAMHDFCLQTEIPEVIDPSDAVSETTEYWNLPAILVDTGLAGQLGGHPIATMKVHIEQTTQPEGVLHATAQGLRIGAMAFNDNGAASECGSPAVPDQIIQYCPGTNKDGAKIISPIKLGTATTDSGIHVDNLVKSINGVHATSWTPLAEAVYNAIGYYTQNRDMRLNADDFQTDSDVMDGWENGRNYAPGSYLMVGGTLYQTESGGFSYDQDSSDGVNFAGDTGVAWTPVGSYRGEWAVSNAYVPYDIVSYGGKLYTTVQTGTAALKVDADGIEQYGPLYDSGVTWEFLIDPVINWCQANYILIITEGASTADINDQVASFVTSTNIIDPGETTADDEADQCTDGLLGSTYMDDLTYFANDPNDYFNVYPLASATLPEENFPFADKPKNNINTYIVTAGLPRDNGEANECNPAYLMNSAAANGGTGEAMSGEDPQALEDNLLAIFNELRQRASAGSAASVISSARGGEGAIYQAIFWPEKVIEDSSGNEISIEWVGDVHGLFLDENGFMYEDTNNDRILNPSEDLDGDGKLDCGEDLNCNGIMDPGEDVDGDGILDLTEDLNGNGIFDILADTDGDGMYDTGLDTNGDGIPDTSEDIDGDGHFDRTFEDVNRNGILDGGDLRVIIYYDNDIDQQKSRGCYNTSIIDTEGKLCTNAKDLEEIHFLWSANQWLSEYPDISTGSFSELATRTNRSSDGFNADSRQRYIFTWNDDGNGIVDDGEVVDFVAGADGGPSWNAMASDFDVVDGIEVDKIIRWVRGEDFIDEDLNSNNVLDDGEDLNGNGRLDSALRSRQTTVPDPDVPASTYPITWRLGDIIHSTPMTVAAPAEGYHLIYNDFSYAQFLSRWKNRRHMVYFGANDGMLHAVNAGFYQEGNNKFYLGYDFGNRSFNDNGPALGTEMWAYVPYNLRPHLKCLTGLDGPYKHKYYVDLRPRIFDVKIFEEEDACRLENGYSNEGCIHPNGWGTILVGGMRLGGTPVDAADLTGADPADNRQFISSYFILDITNPEAPPDLLGELTRENDPAIVDLGYSTVISTMAIVKHGDVNEWYLILGSGPQGDSGMKGLSDQGAKISVLPLDWLISTSPTGKEPLKIPAGEPTVDSAGGTFLAPAAQVQSFVSDLITVDFDIDPSYEDYKADAVYFGTVEGETDSEGYSGFSRYTDGTTYFNGGGHMYRLVMEPTGHIVGKTGGDPVTEPYQWDVTTLLNLGSMTDSAGNIIPQVTGHPIQPITAAPSVGTDGYNFWIYFGTGRFFDPDDKTDRQQQSYYGIKEPMEITDDGSLRKRKLTWAEVELSGNSTSDPGAKGLAKVDEILVGESTNIANAPLICKDGSYHCLELNQNPSFYNASENNAYFDRMEKYIAGTGRCFRNICSEIVECSGSDYTDPHYKNNCTDGWYLDFWPYNNREKNVGQATLLGGLVTFTTYQPNSGVCQAEGASYLYGVYYKTGTAWYENIFGRNGINDAGMIESKLSLGRGMATTPNLHVGTGGKNGEGPKAFVQTSTGEILEIQQENLPIKNYISGRSKWKEFTCP